LLPEAKDCTEKPAPETEERVRKRQKKEVKKCGLPTKKKQGAKPTLNCNQRIGVKRGNSMGKGYPRNPRENWPRACKPY